LAAGTIETMWLRYLLAIAVFLGPRLAHAEPARADGEQRDWHAGLNLRTDFGAHPLRVGGGVRFGQLNTVVAVDPMVLTDGQHDLDLLGEWLLAPGGWSLMGGWRASSIALDKGHQWQQKLVLGVAAGLPSLGGGRVRGRLGFELTTLLVKHGGGLPTDTISFGTRTRGGLEDRLHLGLFVRFEYATGF
jgi:hypothetical protein